MPEVIPAFTISEADQEELRGWVSAPDTPPHVVHRARIVLALAEGQSGRGILRQLHVTWSTLNSLRQRYAAKGKDVLWEAPGHKGPQRLTPVPVLSERERQQIEQWASTSQTPPRVRLRCRIILAAANGQSTAAIVRQIRTNHKTVEQWCRRFRQDDLQCLWEEAAGRGRKPVFGPSKIRTIVKLLRTTERTQGQIAARYGVSDTTISGICKSHRLRRFRRHARS